MVRPAGLLYCQAMSNGGQPRVRLLTEPDGHTRGFRRIVVLLISLVTVPTAFLLAVGVLMLVFWAEHLNIVYGILVVTLVLCLVTGTVLALIFLRQQARLSQLQSDFVSKVSHDLRTPLTSIRMFVETLRRKDLSPEQLDACVDALARETARLTERIERLLDWGRMEAGKRVYELKPESVPEIVTSAVQSFEAATMGQEVVLHVDLPASCPKVYADRESLVDALVNLLSNAVKYSEGVPDIRLGVDCDDRFVRIHVKDKGIGIPRSEQKRIFQKFYRVDERLSQAIKGSGLGLAMVKHIAAGHGGRIEVESERGEGSTFTLVLPQRKELDAELSSGQVEAAAR